MNKEEKQVINQLCDAVLKAYGVQGKPLVDKALEMIKDKENPAEVKGVDKSE